MDKAGEQSAAREQFIAWVMSEAQQLDPRMLTWNPEGYYEAEWLNGMWKGWSARARLAEASTAEQSSEPPFPGTSVCPTCGHVAMTGTGDYSCASCGMGMQEPCEHWKKMLDNPVPDDPIEHVSVGESPAPAKKLCRCPEGTCLMHPNSPEAYKTCSFNRVAPPEPATPINRWDFDVVESYHRVTPNGEWVRYLDVSELQAKVRTLEQALRTIKELGRVTMATEVGREIILAAIDEALNGESRQ